MFRQSEDLSTSGSSSESVRRRGWGTEGRETRGVLCTPVDF